MREMLEISVVVLVIGFVIVGVLTCANFKKTKMTEDETDEY